MFSWFLKFCVFYVSGRCRGPEGVKTAPGDMLGRVVTNFHPHRTAGDSNGSNKNDRINEYKINVYHMLSVEPPKRALPKDSHQTL